MKRLILAIVIASVAKYGRAHGKEPAPLLTAATLAGLEQHVDVIVPAASEVLETCFDGYTLANGECTKVINEPASLVCSVGSLINGACEIVAPYLSQCAAGYTFVDGNEQCVRSWEVPLQFYCPKGYYDNGSSCGRTEPGSVVTECDFGDLIGDNCISYKQLPYELSSKCPDGAYVEEDGNCWKVVDTFDCADSVATAKLVTPLHPSTPILGKEVSVPTKGHVRRLGGKKKKEEEPCETTEIVKEMISVTPPETVKFDVASKLCTKKVFVNAIAVVSCPVGYVDNGKACVQETITPPRVTCLTNGRSEGPCPPLIRHAPKKPGCPKNADKIDGHCMMKEFAAPEKSCAKGFRDTGIACIGQVDSPGYECPPGLLLEGDRCTGLYIRPPVVIQLEPEVPCEKSKKY